ncbi:hypothetical protein BJV78DRAFT_1209230 [Lactifluus subvellereus]|nr:hypothetical protein BJV78DRAFT_1209230 [Lactifluus subvellereus]
MSASPPPGLFQPAQQGHSLATLVLIENSAAMVDRWPDLRDHYLPTLLGTVRKVNPVVPIQVLWGTSCPVSASEEAIAQPNSSRQYNQLPEVRFSQQPNNKITAATLFRFTDLLATASPETTTTRHLFVIAASGPAESVDMPGLPGADPQTVWQALGSKLTKENIHLHMILNPRVKESIKFVHLFYDILGMQKFQEAATWFPADTENYRFYLSMRPQGPQEGVSRSLPSTTPHRTPVGYTGTAPAVSSSLLTPTSGISGLSLASPITGSFLDAALPPPPPLHPPHPPRTLLPRNNSFPPAGANGRHAPRPAAASSTNNSPPPSAANIPPGSDAEPTPSLVKHLQKVHGLTKKRNYGLQTSRAPFIRDETSASPYPPVPSADPANGRPRRNTGVHASKSRMGDDPRRPRRGSVHFAFPESARVPSPESDSSTSVSAPSPTTAASVTGGLQMGMPLSSPSLNLTETSYQAMPPPPGPPPSWQGETLAQVAPANLAPAFTDIPSSDVPPQNHVLSSAQVQRAHVRATVPLASSSYSNVPHGNADSPVAYSTTVAAVGSPYTSQSSAHHTPPPAPAPVPVPTPTTDDGDKPFIFYPEYEDALIPPPPLFTPLSAAAQPTHVAQYWSTASADYSHILNPAVSPGLLRANPPPVYDIPMYDSPAYSPPAHPHVSSHAPPGSVYASEQSSSLQSWAGY